MKPLSLFLPIALLAAVPFPALAEPAAPETEAAPSQADASIPFANHGGVWNWRAEGNRTVYFEDNHRNWYKAELMGFAPDLPFVNFIGLDTRPNGTLDRWSAVYIHGQRYPLTSFVKVDGPPVKKAKTDK
ncbi:DUF6491 family protein [Novosphingobium album (ex Hu et al. 2023)]|uniref:DUF6491 family protein n=1 Tax=Novosphingobium album (ex Hu et al. 2023) TaxID=2930093 RepID=A0ABT0AZA2_9SPHN|nr:DUF6491 family protein [Novosphingobium album (ex Hu et al. 2023)]MCJ2178100.1 DUF6491 family protein [Novosphingobium album (ex Hu et al. 2023)]